MKKIIIDTVLGTKNLYKVLVVLQIGFGGVLVYYLSAQGELDPQLE